MIFFFINGSSFEEGGLKWPAGSLLLYFFAVVENLTLWIIKLPDQESGGLLRIQMKVPDAGSFGKLQLARFRYLDL